MIYREIDGKPHIENECGEFFSDSFDSTVLDELYKFKDGESVGVQFNYNMHLTITAIWHTGDLYDQYIKQH